MPFHSIFNNHTNRLFLQYSISPINTNTHTTTSTTPHSHSSSLNSNIHIFTFNTLHISLTMNLTPFTLLSNTFSQPFPTFSSIPILHSTHLTPSNHFQLLSEPPNQRPFNGFKTHRFTILIVSFNLIPNYSTHYSFPYSTNNPFSYFRSKPTNRSSFHFYSFYAHSYPLFINQSTYSYYHLT